MQIETDSAQVKIPPPIMLLSAIAMGYVLQVIYPIRNLGTLKPDLGVPLFLFALGVVIYCNFHFKKVGTNIAPWKSTSQLMTTGIYGASRNPIYTSFVAMCLAIALDTGNLWMLVMAGLLALALRWLVIAKEEAYLEKKFGEEYRKYKAGVRRWL